MGVCAGLSMYVVVVQKFTFAISSPDEFLFTQTTIKTCTSIQASRAGQQGLISRVVKLPVIYVGGKLPVTYR